VVAAAISTIEAAAILAAAKPLPHVIVPASIFTWNNGSSVEVLASTFSLLKGMELWLIKTGIFVSY
jgi:hypothetical protein